MSLQMTVRMTDEAASAIDHRVAEGDFASRADYLSWLVAKDEMRRRAAMDIASLREAGDTYEEFEGLHQFSAEHPMELD